ncbi:Threonine efflux protein [Paraburkholderia aspalathi]|uniref:Threonine efflux protein n=1 Tax=Paraburkholderia aspalathi TaxID=1324617 RepID=A0ABM8T9D5_9BURK|nr:LysE family transporter [Paraburkholderia aspalathi]MBK3824374.1 LysE family transporter [Paraburkholderia aspalathi]MBK3836231.1 LysE family transporter [Paraburkholderia aspalathi]MBK3865993.1 LysE family transporter [Paraburkholderia aspalathi]CAE6871637.1 Threonine efflux protein [Paraburkholderia aspalathi]
MDVAPKLISLMIVMLVSVISPGPNFMIVSSIAAMKSRRDGILVASGLSLAAGTWTIVSISGVGYLLQHMSWLADGIRVTGCIYLAWLGLKMVWSSIRSESPGSRVGAAFGARPMLEGFLASMTNPKSFAFYLSIFALLIPPHRALGFYVCVFAIPVVISFCWYSIVAVIFSIEKMRAGFARKRKIIDGCVGGFLIIFAGHLFIS